MSVKACDRNCCESTMCDRLSREHGYICDDCYEELIAHGPEASVEEFMASKKKNLEAARARFDAEFPTVF